MLFRDEDVDRMESSWRGIQFDVCTCPRVLCRPKKVVRNMNEDLFWRKESKGECESFVGSIHEATDKTATTLKSIALVLYPVDGVGAHQPYRVLASVS